MQYYWLKLSSKLKFILPALIVFIGGISIFILNTFANDSQDTTIKAPTSSATATETTTDPSPSSTPETPAASTSDQPATDAEDDSTSAPALLEAVVSGVGIADKAYDSTTNATVTAANVTFYRLVPVTEPDTTPSTDASGADSATVAPASTTADSTISASSATPLERGEPIELTRDTDYTISATFADPTAGTNKIVNVAVQLTATASQQYQLRVVTGYTQTIATINKADSSFTPADVPSNLRVAAGVALADVFAPAGLFWDTPSAVVEAGIHTYPASFYRNNDSRNFNPAHVEVPIYGQSIITPNITVEGGHGSAIVSDVVFEGDPLVISFIPDAEYMVGTVMVDGVDLTAGVENNILALTAGLTPPTIIVTFVKQNLTVKVTSSGIGIPQAGDNVVLRGSNFTINVGEPHHGYRLDSILVDGEERIDSLHDGIFTVENVSHDTDVIIVAKRITYPILEGSNQIHYSGESSGLTFRWDVNYEKFKNGGQIYIDGALLSEQYYAHRPGSVIINLDAAAIDGLDAGNHTIAVVMNDGGLATADFTVSSASFVSPSLDTRSIAVSIVTAVLSFVAVPVFVLSLIFLIRRVRSDRREKSAKV